jgi:hypothetical protein
MADTPEQRFRLRESIWAIGLDDASGQIFVKIPTGGEITVVDAIDHTPFVTVNWKGRDLKIFAADLESRGELIRSVGEG